MFYKIPQFFKFSLTARDINDKIIYYIIDSARHGGYYVAGG